MPQDSVSLARYAIGLGMAVMGTGLAIYIFPTSLQAYHWAVVLLAFAMFTGFSLYLYLADPKRMRAFLRSYFTALFVIIVAPTLVSVGPIDLLQVDVIGRIMQTLPVLAAFGAAAQTYLMGAMPDQVVAKWRDM